MQNYEPRHIFVYGTLRSGSQNKFARVLHDRSDFLGGARVQGTLYDLGDHPGLIASQTQGWVRGEVYRLKDTQLLTTLDAYEGGDFERTTVDALLDSGAAERCWVYLFRGDVSGRPQISSGDYLAASP